MPIDSQFASRIKDLQSEAQDLYQKMSGKKEEISVEVSTEVRYAGASAVTKCLYIHPLVLVEPNDLPIDLRISGKNGRYFEELKTWVATKFDFKEELLVNFQQRFDQFLRMWESPIEYSRIKRFAITHEVAHIFHDHRPGRWNRLCTVLCTAVAAIYLFTALQPLVALAITVLVLIVSARALYVLRCYVEQSHEIEADLTALRITKDYKAAKYFFKVLKALEEHQWAQFSWLNKAINAIISPEIVFHLTHPSPQTRIDYLKAAHKA